MVLGTYFAQDGTYSAAAVVSSIVAFLLIANLLLLNEIPDVEADRVGGRRHLPITLGTGAAAKAYCLIVVLTYAVIAGGVILEILPALALLGFMTLPLGIKAIKGASKNHTNIAALIPSLATNVIVVLVTPLLMSIGIMIDTYVA